MRKQQIFMWIIAYFLAVTFMSVSYLQHLLMRLMFLVTIFYLLKNRIAYDDELDVVSSLFICFTINTIQECSLYLTLKAKANLFIEIKVN